MEQKIELRQVRDFGDLVSDTFTFAKQNIKPLLKAVVTICGVFMLAYIVTAILHALRLQENLDPTDISALKKVYGWEFFLNLFFSIAFYTSIAVTVFSYISLYRKKGNVAPEVEEVWNDVKIFFWRIFGATIVLFVLNIIGFAICLAPGVYLWPITMLILAIMIFENCSFGYAFGYGFKLIKDHWWSTFGAFFIVVLIVVIASLVFILPATFLSAGSMILTKTRASVPITILSSVLQGLSQVFMALLFITVSLSYFSLTEEKEGEGLLEKVNRIGEGDTGADRPEEQY